MLNNHIGKHEYKILFAIGSLIGILSFLWIYGIRILDFTYDAWLMNGDIDLRQHYLGWCHYRMSDWHFPMGMIDTLSYPNRVSVIWTDSIPLFAFCFKIFRNVLPTTFQYFGLFGLLSFFLQGGIVILLIRRITADKRICILSVPFFTLSFTMLQRMYYHTALGAQWIILLALLVWFYQNKFKNIVIKGIAWAGIGFLCVSIHSYFVPMVAIIMIGSMADDCLRRKKDNRIKQVWQNGAIVALFCIVVLLTLFLWGAFYENTSPIGEGLGTFGSNLNTFFNPLSYSALFEGLPLYYDFQYEGFGYLGAGMLMMTSVAIVIILSLFARKRKSLSRTFAKKHTSEIVLALLVITFMLLAVLPMVTLGDTKWFGVPYPSFIDKMLGIFRSNGRFIWVPVYSIMLGTIALLTRYGETEKVSQRKIGVVVVSFMAICLMLQILDVSKIVKEKETYFAKTTHHYQSLWDISKINSIIEPYQHFVFMYDENDIIMDTAYYAYYHDMTLNNYYFARSYEEQINSTIEEYYAELEQGNIRDDVIYIFREDDLERINGSGLHLYKLGDHMIGFAEETTSGLPELD